MGRHIFEIRDPLIILRDAVSVVGDFEIEFTLVLSPDNGDLPRMGIDAVFHEFSHGFQRVGLGTGDNADGVPVIGDAQFTGIGPFFTPFSFGYSQSDLHALLGISIIGFIVNLINDQTIHPPVP